MSDQTIKLTQQNPEPKFPVVPQLQKNPQAPTKSLASHFQNLSQIQSKTSSLVKIGLVITVTFSLTTLILLILIVNKTKQLDLIQTQLSAKTGDVLAISNAAEFLNNSQVQQQIILDALPDETKLVDFVSTIELLSSNYSTKHSLEFSALAPTKAANNQYIPTSIEITTDPINFQLFLTGLEKLPYIVEVTSIQSTLVAGEQNIWDYVVLSRIYVQNPFK